MAGSCKGPAGPPARRAGAARAAGRPRRSRGARRAVWAAGCGTFFAGSCKGRCGRSPGGAAAPPKRPQAAETARRAVGLRPMPAVCRGLPVVWRVPARGPQGRPPSGRALHAQRAGPGEAGAPGGPYGRRDAVCFLQGAARGAAGAARAARQRRRSGRRPLKPPGGRLGCARCLRLAGGYGADAKPRGRPVRRGTDTSYLSPQI